MSGRQEDTTQQQISTACHTAGAVLPPAYTYPALRDMFLFRAVRTPPSIAKQEQYFDAPPKIDDTPAAHAEMAQQPRVRAPDGTGSLPHVADMARIDRKASSIRSAFDRSNKRVPSNSSRAPPSPTKRHDSASGTKMLSHEAELMRLKDELEKEKALRRQIEVHSAQLGKELNVLKSELNRKDTYWREEMRKKVHEARQEDNGQGTSLRSSRSQARLGDNGLQRQLTELKRNISRSTRVETVITSDSTFVQEMGSLAHELQNWVVNNYRRARISASVEELVARLEPLVNNQQFERLKPVWANWKPENKIAVLQSTTVAILMDIFEDQLLFGMPPQEEWSTHLRKTARHMSTVLEAEQYNKWRASTLDVIRQTGVMNKAVDSAAATMTEYVTTTLDALCGQASSGTKIASLQPVIRRAITLSHLFRIQRAIFTFSLPFPLTAFDPKTMENIAFDREAEEGQPIDCATLPMIVKLGDEFGANVQWQNVLLKANVVSSET